MTADSHYRDAEAVRSQGSKKPPDLARNETGGHPRSAGPTNGGSPEMLPESPAGQATLAAEHTAVAVASAHWQQATAELCQALLHAHREGLTLHELATASGIEFDTVTLFIHQAQGL